MVMYIPQFNKQVRKEMTMRMEDVGKEVVAQVKKNLSVPTATAGTSRPGQMPHMDSGLLRESIYSETRDQKTGATTIVATDVKAPEDDFPYGWLWEFGNRPFLRPTVYNMMSRIRQLMRKRRGKRQQSTVVFRN